VVAWLERIGKHIEGGLVVMDERTLTKPGVPLGVPCSDRGDASS
jgi:hypothetical protein